MIAFKDLTAVMGDKLLYQDVNLKLLPKRRYGLLGANGCGKTTLLKLITGEEEPLAGSIEIPDRLKVGWLSQDHFRYEDTCILEVVIRGKKALWSAIDEKNEILRHPENFTDELGYRLAELENIIGVEGGYTAESDAQSLLLGLGIEEEKHVENLSILSGGFKLRVLLAQALFSNPDILLLDEPTNHLDIDTIEWLKQYLIQKYEGLLIVISHNRDFINSISTDILDVDYGEIRHYPGNYDYFAEQKILVEEQKLIEKTHIEKKVASMQEFVDRFGAKATKARQAQSRLKMIEKIKIPDVAKSSRIYPYFDFKFEHKSGKVAMKINGISKTYHDKISGNKKVLENVTITINRGERIAISGPNGVGKSTLLKIITGNLQQDSGTYELGHGASLSYFSQDHSELENFHGTAHDFLVENVSYDSPQILYNYLGRVLLGGESISKSVKKLSGGEKSRLVICKMMLEKRNILVLDEPTNHLDIEAVEILKRALKSFEGTVIFVSHDKYFVEHVATRVINLKNLKSS